MRFWNRTTVRVMFGPAIALLLMLGHTQAQAQSGSKYDNMNWTQIQQALQEVLATPDRMDDVEILEAINRFRDPGIEGSYLARSADALDRAFGYVNVSNLEMRLHNFAHQGTDGISPEFFPRPGTTSTDRFHWATTLAVGVEAGTWGSATVIESLGYFRGVNVADWEAKDGQRGGAFADPPQLRFSYPLMAISNLEATWPSSGWPAPEGVEDVWWGADMWKKWERKAEMEFYGEFDDSQVGTRGDIPLSESYPLGIEAKIRGMGYGAYGAVFAQYELTNVSSNTYTNVFIGYPNVRRSPWRGSGSPRGYPVFDTSRNLLYSIGRAYDPVTGTHFENDADPAPFGGLLFLETPTGSFKADALGVPVDNPGQVITRLSLGLYGDRVTTADHKWGYYGALSGDLSQFDDPQTAQDIWKTNHPGAGGAPVLMQTDEHFKYRVWTTTTPTATQIDDQSSGDHTHYPSAGPFTWAAGEKINFVVATVAGATEQELLSNADKAIRSYQAQFAASGPPPSPRLHTNGVSAGPAGKDFDPNIHAYPIQYVDSGSITLTWDGAEAEQYRDPITGTRDFQGFRIYRSSDRGGTWGTAITDESGNVAGYVPIAQFDLEDGVTGRVGSGSYLSLGDDTGLVHTWTDENILDGMEYWYAITAYDYDPPQDPENPTFEASRGSNPNSPNMLSIVAGARPNGYVPGSVSDLTGTPVSSIVVTPSAGPAPDGYVTVNVVDDLAVTGDTYRVSFTDTAVYGTDPTMTNTLGVNLTNLTSGDVLFSGRVAKDPFYGGDLLPVVEGLKLDVEGLFNGVNPYDRLDYDFGSSVWQPYPGYEALYGTDWFMSPTINVYDIADAGAYFTSVEIRFDSTATQYAYAYNRTGGYFYRGYVEVPFTVWDVSGDTDRQINFSYTVQSTKTDLSYDVDDDPLGPNRHYTAILSSDYSGDATPDTAYTTGTMSEWTDGDIMFATIAGTESGTDIGDMNGSTIRFDYLKPITPATQYEFSTTAASIDQTTVDLDAIVVVPNPYYILAKWDRNENQRNIQFRNVPPNSTVDIYTLSGELIASLAHNDAYNSDRIGTVSWNIWTYEFTEAAYGLYIYVVKTANGQKKVGKFAIIR